MMLRSLVTITALLGLVVPTSAADMSGARCDGGEFEQWVVSQLGHGLIFGTRENVPSGLSYGPITAASIVSRDARKLSCEYTINVSGPGHSQPVHGVFTLALADNGTASWRWQAGY